MMLTFLSMPHISELSLYRLELDTMYVYVRFPDLNESVLCQLRKTFVFVQLCPFVVAQRYNFHSLSVLIHHIQGLLIGK